MKPSLTSKRKRTVQDEQSDEPTEAPMESTEERRTKRPHFESRDSDSDEEEDSPETRRRIMDEFSMASLWPFLREREAEEERREGSFGFGDATGPLAPREPVSPFSQPASPFAHPGFNFRQPKDFPIPGDRDEESASSGADPEDGVE